MPVNIKRIRLPGARSRADELHDFLRDAILSGELCPNERLVEASIARIANVSRTPVREALQRLEVDGLVRSNKDGVVVTAYDHEELYDLCVARAGLEGLVAGLAASICTDFDIAHLQSIMGEMEEATNQGEVQRLVELNRAYHDSIWRASRNRYLARELHLLRGLIDRLQGTTLADVGRQRETLDEHNELVRALQIRDAGAAEQCARRHAQKAMAIRLARQSADTTALRSG